MLTVGAISIFYLHLPAAVGIGAYKVDANFVAGGGIYQNANVTYRGVTVGRVESVGLTNDGVVAHMRLNSGTPVPDNVTATVKSVSAVGEQYIDLVPPEKPSSAKLRNGASIGQDRTAIGQDISGLLDEADRLVSSVGDTRLQDLLRETFKAFNGSGPELARLIQSSRLLVDEANANYGQVTQLIDQAGPFLDAQIRGGDDIKSLADGLARFTGEVANADPQLRSTLQTVPGAAEAANETFSGIRPSFPVLAANLANFGRIGVIYNKSLEQALVIFPALMAALGTVAGGVPSDEGGKLDFKIHLQDPPPCTTGFIPPSQIRSPADTTLRDTPARPVLQDRAERSRRWCAARATTRARSSPVRGPPPFSSAVTRRGTCRLGSNPWRGPPIPYGSEPINDPRMILPQNKFPFIPPQVDPDPGPPVVQLPPGVRARTRSGAARAVPAAGAAESSPVRCRRRSRSTRRPTRWCRRTAGRRHRLRQGEPLPLPGQPRRHLRLRTRRRYPPRRRRRQAGQTSPRTTRTARSSTQPGELACSRAVLTNWRPRRTGLI